MTDLLSGQAGGEGALLGEILDIVNAYMCCALPHLAQTISVVVGARRRSDRRYVLGLFAWCNYCGTNSFVSRVSDLDGCCGCGYSYPHPLSPRILRESALFLDQLTVLVRWWNDYGVDSVFLSPDLLDWFGRMMAYVYNYYCE